MVDSVFVSSAKILPLHVVTKETCTLQVIALYSYSENGIGS